MKIKNEMRYEKRWAKSLIWIIKIEKLWRGYKSYEESSDEKEWKNESEGEDGGINGRNKKGSVTVCCHLFVSTPCNYDYANDNMAFLFEFCD